MAWRQTSLPLREQWRHLTNRRIQPSPSFANQRESGDLASSSNHNIVSDAEGGIVLPQK